jgi:hypothetical protein
MVSTYTTMASILIQIVSNSITMTNFFFSVVFNVRMTMYISGPNIFRFSLRIITLICTTMSLFFSPPPSYTT